MDPLLDVLRNYDLKSPSSVSRTLSRFSRARLVELLSELSLFSPPPRTESKGEIAFFPGGGKMGLGCADRVARGLLLMGDHIAYPNALKINATEWLTRLENGENVDQVKDSLNTYLHPYIYQYLQLRPLLDAGLASLVNVTPHAQPRSPARESPSKGVPQMGGIRCGRRRQALVRAWCGIEFLQQQFRSWDRFVRHDADSSQSVDYDR